MPFSLLRWKKVTGPLSISFGTLTGWGQIKLFLCVPWRNIWLFMFVLLPVSKTSLDAAYAIQKKKKMNKDEWVIL